MPGRRIVLVSSVLPHAGMPHAGGVYVHRLARALQRLADEPGPDGVPGQFLVVAPSTPSNRLGMTREVSARHTHLTGEGHERGVRARVTRRVLTIAQDTVRGLDPGLPNLLLAQEISRPGRVRDALVEADVVALEWSECARLAPRIRRLNPSARIVGDFHDVQSQLFAREPSESRWGALYWRLVAARAGRIERRTVAALDVVATPSAKDGTLLGDPPHHVTLHPPIGRKGMPLHEPGGLPTGGGAIVLLVGHWARPENDLGALWFLREAWPVVRAASPDARLRVVGAGAGEALREAGTRVGAEFAGFVPSLAEEYAAAAVAVVPVRTGAGVKVKAIEALLHGVPVVTTTVGAEGIDPVSRLRRLPPTGPRKPSGVPWGFPGSGPVSPQPVPRGAGGAREIFAAVVDDGPGLGAAVADVLRDPEATAGLSREAQLWAEGLYTRERFERDVRAVYG